MAQKLSFIFFVSTMLLMTSAGCYYIGKKILWTFPDLQTKRIYVFITLFLFVLVQALGPFLYRMNPSSEARPFILQWITYVSLGFMASLLFYFLAAETIAWFVKKIPLFMQSPEQAENLERRLFLGVGLFSLASATAGTLTAIEGPQIENVEVPLKPLPPEFHQFKIAQISDLHVGPTINRDYAQKVVDLTLAQKPDVIVLTGDMVDGYPEQLRSQLEPLKSLTAPHGIYYCSGNHEYYWGGPQWCEEFKNMGFEVLNNEHRFITKGESKVCIGGIPDIKAHQFIPEHRADAVKTFSGVSSETTKILLAHQPAAYKQSLEAGVHLQLSGHTHGGQFFPWSIFVALTQKFYRGLYFHENLWVYTNRGTGYWGPPQRFAIPPEITLITLKKES
ncbi:MAG: hypothetical protein RJB66_261 [Pseudomonadota bacterium]|jgi:predicted MPP superfamily phosphohydrolase